MLPPRIGETQEDRSRRELQGVRGEDQMKKNRVMEERRELLLRELELDLDRDPDQASRLINLPYLERPQTKKQN